MGNLISNPILQHIGAATALAGATFVVELVTHTVDPQMILTAAELGFAGSFTYESLVQRVGSILSGTGPSPAPNPSPAPISAPTISWTDLLALEGTATSAPLETIISVATNPTSQVVWYAVADSTGHVVLTNINPNS